jgi:molybdate transport system substrate-binding protein
MKGREAVVTLRAALPVRSTLEALIPAFAAEHGLLVESTYAPSSQLVGEIHDGDIPDVVVLVREALDGLVAEGFAIAEARVVAHSRLGLAPRPGAALPELASPADFVDQLRAASSIAVSEAGHSGKLFQSLFLKLRIAEDIAGQLHWMPGGLVANALLTGDADIALQQVCELGQVVGVDRVVALPAKLQTDIELVCGTVRRSPDSVHASLLANLVTSAAARERYLLAGLYGDPVADA